MKILISIKTIVLSILLSILLIPSSCTLEDQVDPNNPSLEGVLNNATVPELNNIVTGTLSGIRDNLDFYLDDVGVVGREMYRFSASDPRYTTDLMGGGSSVLDNNAFYTTNPWQARYRAIKNCNILIQSLGNTSLPTDQEKQGYLGFANTMKAYELLLALNLTNENGIRIDVSDPDNLGPVVDKTAALAAIAQLLAEGATQLDGASFAFPLSNGFALFNTPANFKRFNQAIAARVALYRGDYTGALAFLTNSFLILASDPVSYNSTKDIGAYHVYSAASGDQLNRFFFSANATGEVRAAHPTFLSDAVAAGEGNDARLSKITLHVDANNNPTPVSLSNLTATDVVFRYTSNTAPIPLIRNEELMLIYAEANIQLNNLAEGLRILNVIRTGNGLAPSVAATQPDLINEMLKQRRYSLFSEGHYWVDMRRYGRLGSLPIDRPGDNPWNCFPIPFAENVASTCNN